ncbi:hypothetical protein EYF80_030202 [Liparis tanakae]|uniref:Uncharacterized protein n=1 Tax=Liparis tanakae TaxID=230148 RepID=A0A4Z2H3U2_9TELE|nr:hypothetical protein EYF80_030202 [Liparis tanakae]
MPCVVFQGLPSKLLFGHADPPSSRHPVTLYEESYRADARPANRSARRLGESERPICDLATGGSGPPRSAKRPRADEQPSTPTTAYGSAYQRHPAGDYCQNRFARAPRALSSHLHAANHIHRDLDLRRRSLLQVPDCWSPPPRSGLLLPHLAPLLY